MAYRRRQQVGRVDTPPSIYNYDSAPPPADSSASSSSASSLATKAIRASSAYRDSSLSSVYEQSALSSPRAPTPSAAKDSTIYEHTSKKDMNESKQGFWGVLARKAKAILDDNDNMAQQHETTRGTTAETSNRSKKGQYHNTYDYPDSRRKTDGPALQRRLDAFASSLNHIGGTIGNALEEGITAVENRTADIIQETRKIQIRKKNDSSRSQNQFSNLDGIRQPIAQTHAQPQTHTNLETQLKASRDVAMAMAAKAKLLLRELKTVKADLAFAKERCAQLEEENRILRESREKGDNPEDDDLIRLQLESLLAEKARLAQENSVYARENRFLREIVEYHQLTMQDVVYLDEGNEEVTEVYIATTAANVQSHSPTPTVPNGAISLVTTQNVSPISLDLEVASQNVNAVNPYVQMPAAEDVVRRH
ncbi:hypothetical protein PHJA_001880400 [Phtheirospermum japonicum]|uniref:Uncharacterized protein n=1 Tax=Phtheirospermum japonicum TaxID=374723 RepID=A0A830CND4_9LAMI|nr:hypothetical protein PHJA_001880400 [Phtheirospermum japonicum]